MIDRLLTLLRSKGVTSEELELVLESHCDYAGSSSTALIFSGSDSGSSGSESSVSGSGGSSSNSSSSDSSAGSRSGSLKSNHCEELETTENIPEEHSSAHSCDVIICNDHQNILVASDFSNTQTDCIKGSIAFENEEEEKNKNDDEETSFILCDHSVEENVEENIDKNIEGNFNGNFEENSDKNSKNNSEKNSEKKLFLSVSEKEKEERVKLNSIDLLSALTSTTKNIEGGNKLFGSIKIETETDGDSRILENQIVITEFY